MTAVQIPPADDDPILDAARATVLDYGLRRTTVSEVARRAGLSRMTVYRRYPDGAELIRALMAREFAAVLAATTEGLGAGAGDRRHGRERACDAAVRTASLMRDHPLLRRLLELEPELLLPYLTEKVGRFQQLCRDALATGIREGQADGSIRAGDPGAMAAAVETAARGFVFAARADDPELGPAASETELARLIGAYLAPVTE